ncbi:nuclear transport factor 2 family protein [Hyphomicrobiales bacterium]|nr:nuclear transport factor 2 family protein [Hyphomicrobiales bacterium]
MMKINTKKFHFLTSVAKLCLVFLILSLVPAIAISEDFKHPGQTNFNVKDRLAIINLVNSYADDYDHNNFSEYLKLFSKDIKCTVYTNDSDPVTIQGDGFREFMLGLRSSALKNNVGPLHFISNLNIKEQTSNSAIVETYVMYVPLDTSRLNLPEETLNNTKITGTARYIFSVEKDLKEIWKIKSYVIKYRQSVVEKTLP